MTARSPSNIRRNLFLAVLVLISATYCLRVLYAFADPQSAEALEETYLAASIELSPYRNAVHLYLRIAGAVWITVEWIAAIVLVRAYYLVRKTFVENTP